MKDSLTGSTRITYMKDEAQDYLLYCSINGHHTTTHHIAHPSHPSHSHPHPLHHPQSSSSSSSSAFSHPRKTFPRPLYSPRCLPTYSPATTPIPCHTPSPRTTCPTTTLCIKPGSVAE